MTILQQHSPEWFDATKLRFRSKGGAAPSTSAAAPTVSSTAATTHAATSEELQAAQKALEECQAREADLTLKLSRVKAVLTQLHTTEGERTKRLAELQRLVEQQADTIAKLQAQAQPEAAELQKTVERLKRQVRNLYLELEKRGGAVPAGES
jgi:chromosome segregation ATPase